MKKKLTLDQINTVEKCNNDYLKILYITDFLFSKGKTKEGYFAIMRESNKTKNINVKKFYLYLNCKFNLKRRMPVLENVASSIMLNAKEEKEVNNLNFIDVYSYNPLEYELDGVKQKIKKVRINNKRRRI